MEQDAGSATSGALVRPAAADPAADPFAVGPESPIVRDAPMAIYATDLDGNVVVWNRACERMFGWTAEEVLGRLLPIIPPEELPAARDRGERLINGETFADIEATLVHRDGRPVHAVNALLALRTDDGEPIAILAFSVDVTDRHLAAEAVARAEHKWRTLLESTSDTVTIVDIDGNVIGTTGEFLDVLGYPSDSWKGRNGYELFSPEDLPRVEAALAEILANPGQPFQEIFRIQHSDGSWELIEFTAVNQLDEPTVQGIVITTRNVTEVRLTEALLADEAGILELIARGAPTSETLEAVAKMIEYHTGGRAGILLLPAVAPADCAVTASLDLLDALGATASCGTCRLCAAAIEGRRTVIVDDIANSELFSPDPGPMLDVGLRAGWSYPILEPDEDEVLGTIAVYYPDPHEPTERERKVVSNAAHLTVIAIERDRAQRNLEHQARHDHLTGLPNRASILDRLDQALADVGTASHQVAVLLIDLDRFKVVNDSLGHGAGDTLLVRFGERLRALVQQDDFVGHFGADEFVVVLDQVGDVEDVRRVTSRLDLALSEPFVVDENEIFLSTSIGVAIAGSSGETSHELLQHADAAMYRAKERGRDRLEIYDQAMRDQAIEHLTVDRELRQAIERAELRLHYQPKIELATGRIIGVEALLRWEHPERGLVLPADFIGVAEETGLIVRIGSWVIEEAVRQARSWVDRVDGYDDFVVAVNVSARQLSAPGFVNDIVRVLDRYDWPPGCFTVELTESILIDDSETTLATLEQLKALGLRLAIDDFGTGYSSLSYLHRFPVDIVKVDRAFVTPLQADGEGSAVATAVVLMARALGLIAAAEGVEEAHQLAGLRRLGCDWAQGFYFAKALPSEEVTTLLRGGGSWQ